MIREQVLGIVAMEPMGEYSANVKYEKLNIVTYNGSTYSALKDTLGNEPTNDEYWQLIAKKGDKGDTYVMTEEDKEEVISEITDNANSVFNQNVDEKTNTFNNNANEKTTTFNTNSTNKTNDYNTNASSKLGTYNENATTKFNSYNSNATAKLEEYNTNANAKLNEYNANADGVMTIAVDTRNELERVKNDILETGEASGDYLHLEDSTMAELQELEVNSVEKQVTTTGKNHLPYPYLDGTKTINGVTFTDNGDGTVTVNGTATEKNANFALMGDGQHQSKILKNFLSGGISSAIIVRAVSHQDGTYHVLGVDKGNGVELDLSTYDEGYIEIVVYAGYTANNAVIKPMLSENGGEWEPYTGLKPSPSPDYPQEIPMITTDSVLKSVGSNLWNLNVKQDSRVKVNEDGTVTINGKGGFSLSIEPITLKAGKTYHAKFELISGSITGTKNVFLVYATISWWLSNGSFASHTPTEDIKRGGVWINDAATFDNATIRIWETEGERSEFEPYQETILNLPIPEGEFVGYINDNAKDTFRVGYNEEDGNYHLYLDKMLGKVVLNGSESFGKLDGGRFYTNVLQTIAIPPSTNSENANIISNYLKTYTRHSLPNFDNGIAMEDKGSLHIKIDNSHTDVSQLKTWLSENNVEVVYQLATSYTLDLGIVDMPLSYDGITNIFVDTDLLMNINTKYYRNFTETVRNLQINNDTLKNELASIESRLSALETSQASVVSESEVEE